MTNRDKCFDTLKTLIEEDAIDQGDLTTIWEDINDGWHTDNYELSWTPKNPDLEKSLEEVAEHLMAEAKAFNIHIEAEELWSQISEYLEDLI